MTTPETKTELLNYGPEEVTLTRDEVPTSGGILNLLPGQGEDGYGKKIKMPWVVDYNGRAYRLYCTIFSNAGTCWFMYKGRKMIVG